MNCFYCKGSVKDSTTNHVVSFDNHRVIIVRGVPCEMCTQCGESFYNDETASQLEIIVNNMKDSLTEVAIINYYEKVA